MITTSWQSGNELIRYTTLADLPHILTMLSDPEVGRWLWFTPAPLEMLESYFTPLIEAQGASLADGERPETAVFTIENGQGRFLGHCAVVAVEGSPDGFEIGFQLSRESWGHGLGTRLGEFLCTYAIHCCAAFRIEANCLEGNVGSRTILTRLGLEIEGTRPAYRMKEKARHAELLFGAEVSRLDSARFRRCADELGLG